MATKKATKAGKKKLTGGDPDVELAKARSFDGDTANDDAGDDADTVAEDAGGEGSDDHSAVAGHAEAGERADARDKMESGTFSVETEVVEAEEEGQPDTKKFHGSVILKTVDGDEYEFGVSSISTARHIANTFSGLADELTRRRL